MTNERIAFVGKDRSDMHYIICCPKTESGTEALQYHFFI